METPMDVEPAPLDRRCDSIGTLTGWQLLAHQVTASAGEQGSGSYARDDATAESDQRAGNKPGRLRGAGGGSRNQRLAAHNGDSSCMSDDDDDDASVVGAAAAAVAPRPHQWLYKEYKIQDEIGSGGFGRVCRARRLNDGKVVVVKEIKTSSLSAKQKASTMDEVSVLAKFNHPNIVKYHDCFMDDVYINIVMEYCNGGDLAGLLKSRAGLLLPEDEVMALFVQICLALQYVHAAGVLHRDLKTSNVLISCSAATGSAPLLKLGDFGVAKIGGADSAMASTIVGTPQYLSPEMCDNRPYGKKSDVWALGCILYELTSLTKAFDAGGGGISGVILKIMRGAYPPLPAGTPAGLVDLVGSMLRVEPAERPSVLQILSSKYVRPHLESYLQWARGVPEAAPEVLLASLSEATRGAMSMRPRPPSPAPVLLAGGGGSGAVNNGSGASLMSPTAYAAAAAAAGLGAHSSSRRGSGGSSSGTSSCAVGGVVQPARSGNHDINGTHSAATVNRQSSPNGSGVVNPLQQQQQQQSPQRQQQVPPTSLSGWLESGGTSLEARQQQQRAVLAGMQQQQPQQAVLAQLQQQQLLLQRAPGGSCGSTGSTSNAAAWGAPPPPQLPPQPPPRDAAAAVTTAFAAAAAGAAGAGAPPRRSPPLATASGSGGSGGSSTSASGGTTRRSIAQEQLEGLRLLRHLKARLQVPCSGEGSSATLPQTPLPRHEAPSHAGLASLLSLDSEGAAAAHSSAML